LLISYFKKKEGSVRYCYEYRPADGVGSIRITQLEVNGINRQASLGYNSLINIKEIIRTAANTPPCFSLIRENSGSVVSVDIRGEIGTEPHNATIGTDATLPPERINWEQMSKLVDNNEVDTIREYLT
ncbi:MAG: hypothetical protein ACKO96_26145, partial [Flammeovirgaceae bacterium]